MKLTLFALLLNCASALAVDSCEAFLCVGGKTENYSGNYRMNCFNGRSHRKMMCFDQNFDKGCTKITATDPEKLPVQFLHMMALRGYWLSSGTEENGCKHFYFQRR